MQDVKRTDTLSQQPSLSVVISASAAPSATNRAGKTDCMSSAWNRGRRDESCIIFIIFIRIISAECNNRKLLCFFFRPHLPPSITLLSILIHYPVQGAGGLHPLQAHSGIQQDRSPVCHRAVMYTINCHIKAGNHNGCLNSTNKRRTENVIKSYHTPTSLLLSFSYQ